MKMHLLYMHEIPSFYLRFYQFVSMHDKVYICCWIDIMNPIEIELDILLEYSYISNNNNDGNDSYKYTRDDIHKWKVKSFPQIIGITDCYPRYKENKKDIYIPAKYSLGYL